MDSLKSALEVSSSNNRNWLLIFLGVLTYIALSIFQTTDLELLIQMDQMQLPIVNIPVPIDKFFFAAPLIILILHYNLLLNLHLHQEKLTAFMKLILPKKGLEKDVLYDQKLILYPFLYNLKEGEHRKIINTLILLIYYLIPSVLMFLIFLRFSSYESLGTKSWHLLLFLTDLFAYKYFSITNLDVDIPKIYFVQKIVNLLKNPFYTPVFVIIIASVFLFYAGGKGLDTPDLKFAPLTKQFQEKLEKEGKVKLKLDKNWLRNINLSKASFCPEGKCYVAFENLNFTGANLTMADFTKAELGGTDFQDAKLIGANFRAANIEKSVIDHANLIEANFTGADLTMANFTAAELGRTGFQDANLTAANFSNATMINVKMKEAILINALFEDAKIVNTDFESSNLGAAYFHKATLEDVNFTNVNLQTINFQDTNLKNVNLSKVWLAGSQWREQQLKKLYDERSFSEPSDQKVFACLDYLSVKQVLYHDALLRKVKGKAEQIITSLKQCPKQSIEFVKSHPSEWDYMDEDSRDEREDVFEEISSLL